MTSQKKKLSVKSKRRLLGLIQYGIFGACIATLSVAAAFRLQPLQQKLCPIEQRSSVTHEEPKSTMPVSVKKTSSIALVPVPHAVTRPVVMHKVVHTAAKAHSKKKLVAKHAKSKKLAKHTHKSKKLVAKNSRRPRPQVLDFTQ